MVVGSGTCGIGTGDGISGTPGMGVGDGTKAGSGTGTGSLIIINSLLHGDDGFEVQPKSWRRGTTNAASNVKWLMTTSRAVIVIVVREIMLRVAFDTNECCETRCVRQPHSIA